MKVRATELGFYGGQRRFPGEVFDFAGDKIGTWFEPVADAERSPVEKPAKRHDTLSAMTREQEAAEIEVVRRKSA